MEHIEKLNKLAQSDETYCLWENCYRESAEAFEKFANAQPEEVKNLLWSYAEAGRLMYQRKVILACEHMEFPKK